MPARVPGGDINREGVARSPSEVSERGPLGLAREGFYMIDRSGCL